MVGAVLQSIARPISLRAALTATFESVFFQQVVPAGIGGDISRGVRASDSGVSPQWALIGVVIDRGVGLLFVSMTIVVAAAVAQSSGDRVARLQRSFSDFYRSPRRRGVRGRDRCVRDAELATAARRSGRRALARLLAI